MLIISNSVWNEIAPLIPGKKSKIGRPLSDSRMALSGIFYIMLTGAQWRQLPDYYGKPSTVHGRFRTWVTTGVFAKILERSIDVATQRLGYPQSFFTDTASFKAPLARFGGKNPTDRAKNGVKKGLVIDWNRIVLSVITAAANRHDSKLLLPHLPSLKKFLNRPKVMASDSA